MGGYCAPNTFRKTYQKNAKKSKYEHTVMTAEELAQADTEINVDD